MTLKKPEDIPGDTLQSPSDPDAAYGHKGKGYKALLTETCSEENAFQVITDVWVDGANASDQKDIPKVIERIEEVDTKPEGLFADGGYGCGDNIVVCREHEVTLTAPNTLGKKPDMNKVQLSDFEVGEDGIRVISCIKGHVPLYCALSGKGKTVEAVFPKEVCSVCEFLPICPVKRIKRGKYRLRFTPEAMGHLQAQAGAGRQGFQRALQDPVGDRGHRIGGGQGHGAKTCLVQRPGSAPSRRDLQGLGHQHQEIHRSGAGEGRQGQG